MLNIPSIQVSGKYMYYPEVIGMAKPHNRVCIQKIAGSSSQLGNWFIDWNVLEFSTYFFLVIAKVILTAQSQIMSFVLIVNLHGAYVLMPRDQEGWKMYLLLIDQCVDDIGLGEVCALL